MSAWIPVYQSLRDHRKLLRLAAELAVPPVTARGHLVTLWLWAVDNADQDGSLGNIAPASLAVAADWQRPAQRFTDALVSSGFAERDANDAITLHDWPDYAGRLNAQRAAARERTKRARDAQRARTVRARHAPREENTREQNSTQDNDPPCIPPQAGGASAAAARARNGSKRRRDVVALRSEQTLEERYLGERAGRVSA